MDLLKTHNYERIAGARQQVRMTGGIGFSYLYNVPERKRGRFKPFAGQLIRMVYVDSAKNYLEISVGQVPIDQRGVSYRSLAPTTSAIEFDPRTVYLQVSVKAPLMFMVSDPVEGAASPCEHLFDSSR